MGLDLKFVHFRELRWMLHFHLPHASTNIMETLNQLGQKNDLAGPIFGRTVWALALASGR